jgi:predicted dehydrogenase
MRILVTGRGSIAQRHVRVLRRLRPGAQLIVVASAGEVANALQPCEVVTGAAAGFARSPHAVVIASISSRHADEAAECLRRGLPTLIEKPLVTHRAGLALLQDAVAAAPPSLLRQVAMGCNLRFLPAIERMRTLLADGALGRLVRAHLEVGQDLRQWRPGRDPLAGYSADAHAGGGVVFDLVHEIDLARHLLGPLTVAGAVGGRRGGLLTEADDVLVGLLRGADGLPVTVSLDCVSARPVRRYAVVGSLATLRCDVIEGTLRIEDAAGIRDMAEDLAAPLDVGATYQRQMADWLAAIDDPARAVRVPLAEGLATSALMLALQEAAA